MTGIQNLHASGIVRGRISFRITLIGRDFSLEIHPLGVMIILPLTKESSSFLQAIQVQFKQRQADGHLSLLESQVVMFGLSPPVKLKNETVGSPMAAVRRLQVFSCGQPTAVSGRLFVEHPLQNRHGIWFLLIRSSFQYPGSVPGEPIIGFGHIIHSHSNYISNFSLHRGGVGCSYPDWGRSRSDGAGVIMRAAPVLLSACNQNVQFKVSFPFIPGFVIRVS